MSDREWQEMATAPKGTPSRYGSGPHVLGVICRDWGAVYQIVSYQYHKNGKTGSWKGHHGVWEPDFWMHLPPAPSRQKEDAHV